MQFKTLQLENFKSFRKPANFTFAEDAGLHFLTGRNAIEPELGANGAGKSSIFDALFWVLYGRTARGVKAGNVRSWESSKACKVQCEFGIDETLHTLERTWGPNSLKLNGRVIEQGEIDTLINLTPEEFNYSIFASQFGQMFFDLTPSEKLSIFTDVMALENWMDRSNNATKQAKGLDSELREIQSTIDHNEGELEALEIELARNKSASDNYEKQKVEDLKRFKQRHSDMCNDHDGIIDQLEETLSHQSSPSELEDTKEFIKQIDGLVNTLDGNAVKFGQFNIEQKMLEKEAAKFEDVKGVCPYCKQHVSEQHLEEEMEILRAKISKVEDTRWKLERAHKKIAIKCTSLEEKLEMIESSNTQCTKIKEEDERAIAALEQQLSILSREIDQQEEIIDFANKQSNPFTEVIEAAKKQQHQLIEEQTGFQRTIIKLRQTLEGMQFWAKGFKDLRLFLVEEALTQLEVEINNNLLQLGLRNWAIKLNVERETASGGVAKGFHVAVQSPYNPKPVPWAVWSGGESQRLRLAGTMGLADLILARKGIDCNVEIYDEPTAHLSQSGIEDLLDSLYHRAIERQKQIWLVDHRSLDAGQFSSTTTIVKDREGSHVVV